MTEDFALEALAVVAAQEEDMETTYVVKVYDEGKLAGFKHFDDKELAMFYASEANDHISGRFHWVEEVEAEGE